MKRFTSSLSIILVVTILLAVPISAEEVAPRSSAFFTSYGACLQKTSAREFQIWFDVLGKYTMDKIGASWIEIQRSSNGSTWTTMKTAYAEDYPQMMKENGYFCTDYITYTGTVGYYYRACVKFYAQDGNNSGAFYHYTDVLKL